MNNDRTTNDHLEQIVRLSEMFQQLKARFHSLYDFEVTEKDIMEALYLQLYDKHSFEWIGDLWDVPIQYDEAEKLLLNFDFACLRNTIETDENLLPRHLLIQRKARFKHNNQVWVIHKYDQDPFPSMPHAHDVDNSIKLDLSNGKCYRVKQHVHTIPKKHLLQLRRKAEQVFHGQLPELDIS